MIARAVLVVVGVVGVVGCAGEDVATVPATVVVFDLAGDPVEGFFDAPFPSDLRIGASERPDFTGFPNPQSLDVVTDLLRVAPDRPGFPVQPVAYFRFTAPLRTLDETQVLDVNPSAPAFLVDLERDDPNRGALVPIVATTLEEDPYTPANVLALAPRPGFVLAALHRYAYVVRRDLADATGERLGLSETWSRLANDAAPESDRERQAQQLYASLWPVLAELGVPRQEVAAATVFTTGDVVAELEQLSDRVLATQTVQIENLALDPSDGAVHERYCELVGTVELPQFQQGMPPFPELGLFEIVDGSPVVQRQERVPVTITIPKSVMPAEGYPLMIYFHGSGGVSGSVVDRGAIVAPGGEPTVGEGPAYVVAEHGIGTISSALPLNPERLEGASDISYLNFANLAAFRDTFRQGVIEQRLLLEAALAIELAASSLDGCPGPSLPRGATSFRFNREAVVASGQSMGGMYTNLVGAVEPLIRAVVPTGAGGYWSYFILDTGLLPSSRELLGPLIGTRPQALSFMHPVMHLLEYGWEAAEPFAFMPRLAVRPLVNHPRRPIYQPVGVGDVFFSTAIYDAAALAYGTRQAGEEVWPSMQDALTLDTRHGLDAYPVASNVTPEDAAPFTAVVVQYAGDGLADPHYIYSQLDPVKRQYGHFFASFLNTGVAEVISGQ